MRAARNWIRGVTAFLVGLVALLLALSWLLPLGVLLALATLVLTRRRKRRGLWLVALAPSVAALLYVAALFVLILADVLRT